ncbi:MAG: winged helix-turn-helix transcriptional regulator [Anaerolineae bacterium]|nr:winged helix-turn-helix transcriptional regulator [Anaerolineae bacterium]
MTTTYEALAEPTRRQILDLLRLRPRMVGELVDALGMSQPLVSKHLRVLREAGLVSVRQDAQRRWYEIQPEPLAEMAGWLAPFQQMAEAQFDRLETLLTELQEKENDDGQGTGNR